MSTPDRSTIHVACQLTLVDFLAHFDAGPPQADAGAMLFTLDGRWERADGLLVGREAIANKFRARAPGLLLRHVLSNVRTQVLAPDLAVVHSYVMVLRHQASEGAPVIPVRLEGIEAFGRYVDHMRCIDGCWLIERKQSIAEFKS